MTTVRVDLDIHVTFLADGTNGTPEHQVDVIRTALRNAALDMRECTITLCQTRTVSAVTIFDNMSL